MKDIIRKFKVMNGCNNQIEYMAYIPRRCLKYVRGPIRIGQWFASPITYDIYIRNGLVRITDQKRWMPKVDRNWPYKRISIDKKWEDAFKKEVGTGSIINPTWGIL